MNHDEITRLYEKISDMRESTARIEGMLTAMINSQDEIKEELHSHEERIKDLERENVSHIASYKTATILIGIVATIMSTLIGWGISLIK